MRKSLLASAVLAAIAVPALADSVTLYGQANAAFISAKKDAGAGGLRTNRVDAGGDLNTPSRFGLKGEEDLGGGLKAFFQVEQAVALDDGGADGNTSNRFADREGWVGLSGDFGKFGLGRGKTPYTNLADTFDSSVDGFNNLAIYNVDNIFKTDTSVAAPGSTTATDPSASSITRTSGVITKRFNNSIRYDSPNIEGFRIAADYGLGENKTSSTNATNYFSVGANYTAGALFIGAAYNDETNLPGALGAAGSSNNKHDAWLLAGTYSLDTLKFGLGYQAAKQDLGTNEYKRDAFVASVSYGLGQTTLKAGAIFFGKQKLNGADVTDSEFTRYSVGAKYAFSKMTSAFAEYSGDSVKSSYKAKQAEVDGLSLGLMHAF